MDTQDGTHCQRCREPFAMSQSEAAAFVGLSLREIQKAIHDREIKVRYRGTKCLVDVADLKAWFDALPSEPPNRR